MEDGEAKKNKAARAAYVFSLNSNYSAACTAPMQGLRAVQQGPFLTHLVGCDEE